MKTVFILFISFDSDKNFEYIRLYQNEDDAKQALKDAEENDELHGAFLLKTEIHENYNGEMKEKYGL